MIEKWKPFIKKKKKLYRGEIDLYMNIAFTTSDMVIEKLRSVDRK